MPIATSASSKVSDRDKVRPRPRIRTYYANGCVSVIRNSLDDGWNLQKSRLHEYWLDHDVSEINEIIKKATNE